FDPSLAPEAPGSYQFLDSAGRHLYVGKAKNLRARLTAYVAPEDPRIAAMVAEADHVEWVTVRTEAEALLIEAALIHTHQPPYNIRLRDADGYPYVALDDRDGVTRVLTWRGRGRAK